MFRTISLLVIVLVVALGCERKGSPKPAPAPFEDKVIDVKDDDPAMNQAIAEARAHLLVFEEQLALRKPGQVCSVKKPFARGESAEHMWLTDVKVIEDGFEGRLDSDPRDVRDAKIGERYRVTRAELSDWLVFEPGKLWGGYTLRVLLPTMDPKERAAFTAQLQPLPTDADLEAARAAAAARAPAQRAIGELKKRLVTALTDAMGRGVPAAIEVCSTVAPAAAANFARQGLVVGRATRKPRRSENLASGWQADALTHFEALVAAGTPLEGAAFVRPLPEGRIAYAEPLMIQPLCLACHGTALAPEVSAALAKKYPEDRATGYALGELRGVVWADTSPAPAPR
jgi:uncharacterized protein YegJ (DUF2314 family)